MFTKTTILAWAFYSFLSYLDIPLYVSGDCFLNVSMLCMQVQAAHAEEGRTGGSGETSEGAAGKDGARESNTPSHS